MVTDEFAARFVYFYTGYILAPQIFALTARAQAKPLRGARRASRLGRSSTAALSISATRNLPFVSLALGLAGACAVVTVAALMARSDLFKPLRYCGRNSIVIYLAFFLPMAVTRTVLLKTGLIADVGTMSAARHGLPASSARSACSGPCAERCCGFLFERPALVARAAEARIGAAAGGIIHSRHPSCTD